MKNTEGVPRGRGLAAPESEYPMVLLCVSVCKHSNYREDEIKRSISKS